MTEEQHNKKLRRIFSLVLFLSCIVIFLPMAPIWLKILLPVIGFIGFIFIQVLTRINIQ